MVVSPKGSRRRYAVPVAGAIVAALGFSTPTAAHVALPAQDSVQTDGATTTYLVQLAGDPLVSYPGGVDGIPATQPKGGAKLDTQSTAAQRYTDHLSEVHTDTLAAVGADRDNLVADYTVALNGFAATLTPDQAAQLRATDQVVNLWTDETRQAATTTTPDYLGLTGAGGVWNTQFGGAANAGQGVVIGVIDSGIAIDNPSFAPLPGATAPDGFTGTCDPGATPGFECNSKVVGARYYGADFGNSPGSWESVSPVDDLGHGSHVAGIAAGNLDLPMSIKGLPYGAGSGVAPGAHLAVYKALWADGFDGSGSGTTAGIVAAIDDAVADGVDVINYSVTGSSTSIVTPEEVAFLGAAQAGIFVATSASSQYSDGRPGVAPTDNPAGVAHLAPWTTTVASGTHDRNLTRTVTFGDGSTLEGVGRGPGLEPTPLVFGSEAALPGAPSGSAAEQCLMTGARGEISSLDPEVVRGKVVVCQLKGDERERVDPATLAEKGRAVAQAGGVGMIVGYVSELFETVDYPVVYYPIPTIQLGNFYEIQGSGTTAELSGLSPDPAVAPSMGQYSPRGPAAVGGGDLLKPELLAPGVDVIAASASDRTTGEPTFASMSGTSMAAPHVAGLAALMRQKYPDWSPMAIKSALMTTADVLNNAGGPIKAYPITPEDTVPGLPPISVKPDRHERIIYDATPLDFGAGEVEPAAAYSPGLVYDSDAEDWVAYACAIGQWQLVGQADDCTDVDMDPSDFNSPSIAIGDLVGTRTVTRTVTNVTGAAATYTAEVSAPRGMEVTVSPSTLTVPAGGSASFEVTLTQLDRPYSRDGYLFGSLTWVNGDTRVRSTIAVLPVGLVAPTEIVDEGTYGAQIFEVTPGYSGVLETYVQGFVPSEIYQVQTQPGTGQPYGTLTIPAETFGRPDYVRFATFADEVEANNIELYAWTDAESTYGRATSGSSTSDDSGSRITIVDPQPGQWMVQVVVSSGERLPTVPLHVFLDQQSSTDVFTVKPQKVQTTSGVPEPLTVQWGPLEVGRRYLGQLNYPLNDPITFVSINAVPKVDRIGGTNRYDTATQIAAQYPAGVERVYVASGAGFADALSGAAPAAASLAPKPMETVGGKPAPVLLTDPATLPPQTIAALESLQPSQIVILGGTAAVSDDVATSLAAYGQVERVGGETRYDTSAMLAELYSPGVETVYLAAGTDENFADALSGGALAGRDKAPVLLTRQDRIDPATQRALDHLQAANVVVLGGEKAVPPSIFEAVGGTGRLAGATRYDTSVAISGQFAADADGAFVASGTTFPDALTGSALAGYRGQPLLLSSPASVPGAVMDELGRLAPTYVGLLGGPAALSNAVEDQLNTALPTWVE